MVLGIASIYIFSKPIKRKITQTISDQLASPVAIADIKLSAFKNFPYVSVSFHNINATESSKITGKPLLLLDNFSVTINPLNLLRGNYTLENVKLEKGEVIAAIKKGKNNFSIFKETKNATAQKYKVSVKKITVSNLKVSFYDKDKGDTVAFLVNNIQLSGRFSEKEFLVTTGGSLLPLSMRIAGEPLVLNKPLTFSTSFTVNKPDSSIVFKQTKFTVEEFNFLINGKVEVKKSIPWCNVQVMADNLSLEKLVKLVPPKYLKDVEAYESSGQLEFKADIKGKISKTDIPAIKASFKMADGTLGKKGMELKMRNIELAGLLDYHKDGQITYSVLELKQMSATLNGEKVLGRAKVAGFDDPYIEAAVEGTFNLTQWARLFKLEMIDTVSGFATVNIEADGRLSAFKKSSELVPARFQATATAQNVALKIKDDAHVYRSINGKIMANNNLLQIDTFSAIINDNILGMKGKANNLLDFLFSNKKDLVVAGEIYSPNLDIPRIVGVKNSKGGIDTTGPGLTLPKNISFKLKTRLDRVLFDRFDAKNFNGLLTLNDGVVTVHGIDFDAMGGNVAITANIYDKGGQNFVLTAKVEAQNIEIQQFFYQCRNFGQKQLTSDNLQGGLTTRLQIAAPMDKYLRINNAKLFAGGTMLINGGRLFNYEPLKKLSRFININELQDIAFDKLENTFEIKDSKIYFPKMLIKNSLLNLELGGIHTFENIMDYNLKLRLKDAIAKKFNRKGAKKGNYEEDTEGVNLFLRMKGSPEDLKIVYDVKSAVDKLKKDIIKEKDDMLDILREEFGIKKKSKDGKTEDKDVTNWEDDIPQ